MNLFIIERYIQKIRKEDIYNYAYNQGINLNSNDLNTIYNYLKNHYKTFLYNKESRLDLLTKLKNIVSPNIATKLDELYYQYNDKI